MHIILKNEVTGDIEGIICVDRTSQTCHVLRADVDNLDDIVQLALSMKVSKVLLEVPIAAVKEMESYGWSKVTDFVLMAKKGSNGNKST